GSGGINTPPSETITRGCKTCLSNRCATAESNCMSQVPISNRRNLARIDGRDRLPTRRAGIRRVGRRSLGDGSCRETNQQVIRKLSLNLASDASYDYEHERTEPDYTSCRGERVGSTRLGRDAA